MSWLVDRLDLDHMRSMKFKTTHDLASFKKETNWKIKIVDRGADQINEG